MVDPPSAVVDGSAGRLAGPLSRRAAIGRGADASGAWRAVLSAAAAGSKAPSPWPVRRPLAAALLSVLPFAAGAASVADLPAPREVRIAVGGLDGSAAIALRAFWFAAPAGHGDGAQDEGRDAQGKRPAVVLLHGCGGAYGRDGRLARRYTDHVTLLHSLGIGGLVVDSLGTRGEKELCTQKIGERAVTQADRRRDALAALAWLAAQPGVDAGRLGLLGWSNGGSTVLAATNLNHPEVKGASARASFAIAFYPGCEAERRRGYATDTPLLLLLGGSDDWTPPEPCLRLAQDAQGAAMPQWVLYPGAFHGFDGDTPPRSRKDVPNGANPGQGVTVGGDPQARALSRERLRAFLAQR